jgi:GNAT superfamily N-acetyltransferase
MARLSPPRPLGEDDAVEAFDCGRESMNEWFRRQARRNQAHNISRTTVFTEAGSGAIVGYVTLATGQIEREYLPKSAQRDRPEAIPVILLGQLAVDRRFQGQGFARQLLFYALKTCLALSREIGCFGVITHPLDDAVRIFYGKFGFVDLPGDPRRAQISIAGRPAPVRSGETARSSVEYSLSRPGRF